MEKRIISTIILLIVVSDLIFAGNYSIEFSQVKDKAVVKEIINGIKQESYVDSEIIEQSGNNYYFVKKLVFPEDFDNAKIILNLDAGVIISEMGAFPANYQIQSDGKIINLVWNIENVKKNQTIALFANLKDTKFNNSWTYWALGLGVVLIILLIIYNKFGKKEKIKIIKTKYRIKKKHEEKYDKKLEYLLDTEKKVIELLKNADRHELWQKQIQNATSFSKAKVSRLVRNLEARGIVVKIPFGNTNKVRLK